MYKPLKPMSDDEIRRWLRRFQHDPEFRTEIGTKTVPLAPLCEHAGVRRRTVYYFLEGLREVGDVFRLRMSDAIRDVQGGLRFAKRKRGKLTAGRPVIEKRGEVTRGG